MVMDPKMSVGLETPSVNINLSSTWMPSLATPSLKLPTPILDGLGNGDWGQPSATTGTAGGGGLLSATGPGLLGSGMSPRLMLESLRMSPGVSGSIAPNMDAPKASTASLAELFICSEYQMPASSPQAAPNTSTPMSKPIPTLPTSVPQSQGMTYSQPQTTQMHRLPAKSVASQPQQQLSDRPGAQPAKSESQTRQQVTQHQKAEHQMQRQQEQQRQHHQQQQHHQQHQQQPIKRDHTHQVTYQQHHQQHHHQEQQRLQAQSLPMPPAMLRQQAMSSGMVYSQQLTNPYAQAPNVSDRLPPHAQPHAQRLGLGSSHQQLRGPVHHGMRPLPDHRIAQVGAIPPQGMHPPPHPTLKRMPGMAGMPVMHGEPTGPSSSAIEEAKQLAQDKADKFAQKRKRSRKQVEEEKPKDSADTEEDKKLSPADLKRKRYNRRLELNRQSAAVSRVRRRAYVEELEGKLMHVEKEKLSLEDQVTVMHSENMKLREQMRQLHEQLSGAARGNSAYPPASMPRQDPGKQ